MVDYFSICVLGQNFKFNFFEILLKVFFRHLAAKFIIECEIVLIENGVIVFTTHTCIFADYFAEV
jgi:hypothetical protein